ncbi:MAG TPA: hypothetical protein VMN39_10575, partial [Longimicrobiaceae bacterium]|nr:hypothetical protein [Longimicrobiaceae bacterium]
ANRVENGPGQRPLDRSEAEDFNLGSYRYGYAPLQLFTLEAAIGEPLTRALLRAMITAPPAERANADFAFVRRTALAVGVPAGVWDDWEERCLRAPAAGECLQPFNP